MESHTDYVFELLKDFPDVLFGLSNTAELYTVLWNPLTLLGLIVSWLLKLSVKLMI